jgi:hypothetical protein
MALNIRVESDFMVSLSGKIVCIIKIGLNGSVYIVDKEEMNFNTADFYLLKGDSLCQKNLIHFYGITDYNYGL